MISWNFGLMQSLLYIAAAVTPALVLCYFVYRHDRIEKEPGSLLKKLFIGGIWSAAVAMVIELGAENVLPYIAGREPVIMAICEATMVAIAEECAKFYFLKRRSWNNPNFNYRFDGIVYAVTVSLGFAAIENVLYVFSYGTVDIMVQRAILTIPAHMSFAVYMGYYYGLAKTASVRGNQSLSRMNIFAAVLIAVLLHAIYDGALMIGTEMSMLFFLVFVIFLDIFVIIRIKNEAKHDEPIW